MSYFRLSHFSDIEFDGHLKLLSYPEQYSMRISSMLEKFNDVQKTRIIDLINRVYTATIICNSTHFESYLRKVDFSVKHLDQYKSLDRELTHWCSAYVRDANNTLNINMVMQNMYNIKIPSFEVDCVNS